MSVQSDGPQKGSLTIDVLIPAIDKDIATLPLVINSLRRHVQHRIGTIYIVSPQSAGIRRLCASKGCTFVDEKTVLPITKNISVMVQHAGTAQAGCISNCSK